LIPGLILVVETRPLSSAATASTGITVGQVGDFCGEQSALTRGEVPAVQVRGEDNPFGRLRAGGERVAIGGEVLGVRFDAGELTGPPTIAPIENAVFKEGDGSLLAVLANILREGGEIVRLHERE